MANQTKGWIDDKLLLLRGQRIMLDTDLARSLHTTTAHIARTLRRHSRLFGPETMFRLSRRELAALSLYPEFSRIRRRKGSPIALTRDGVGRLSDILYGRVPPSRQGTCGRRAIVFSRVCGYFRPVRHWCRGKLEEFKDRKYFMIPELERIPARKRKKNTGKRRHKV